MDSSIPLQAGRTTVASGALGRLSGDSQTVDSARSTSGRTISVPAGPSPTRIRVSVRPGTTWSS